MKNVNVIGTPRLDFRAEQPTLGIRIQTPMRGMSKAIDQLSKELAGWIKKQGLTPAGPPFLRYHVIDMDGDMDIEFGIPVSEPNPGDERVKPGLLPAGRYASLVFSGSGYQGNKALIEWASNNRLAWDRWDDPKGDAFRSRYETFLTDPKIEPRKTKWQVEVAIKVSEA